MAKDKPPRVKDAEITQDGCIVIELSDKIYPHTGKVMFTPEVLFQLAKDYGEIPPPETNDYDGVPVVEYDAVYDGDEEDGDEKGEEDGEGK